MRFIVALVCLVLAVGCGYGFMASMEPGVALMWKAGFALASLAFVLVAFVVIRPARLPR